MKYEYKMVSVPKSIAVNSGNDLGATLADYVQNEVNKMANEGWEFYRADSYLVSELPGCLASLFGQSPNCETYNLLTFRKGIN